MSAELLAKARALSQDGRQLDARELLFQWMLLCAGGDAQERREPTKLPTSVPRTTRITRPPRPSKAPPERNNAP